MPKITTWILLCGLATVGAGQSIIFSVLPPLGRQIGMPDYQVALIFTLAAIAFMVSAPYWGRKSDEWGRKKMIAFGFLGYAASTGLFGLFGDLGRFSVITATSAFLLMTFARLCYALLSSGVFPAVQAAIAESTGEENRSSAMASIQAAYGIGMVGGPGIASLLVVISITLPLYVSAAISAVAGMLVLVVMPETKKAKSVDKAKIKLKVTDSRIFFLLLSGFAYFIALSGLLQLAAFRYQDLFQLTPELAAAQTSIGFVCSAVATIITQLLIIGRLRLAPANQIVIGLVSGASAFFLMTLPEHVWQMHALFVLFGLSTGLMTTGFNTAVTLAVDKDELGAVSGLAAGTQAAGYVVGPLLSALLYQMAAEVPFQLFALLLGLFCALVLLRWKSIPGQPVQPAEQ
ncbi:multidrug-efflux transporter [Photobacterium marinum]|uniref:Multidrug-efflux transporter n=1 Tax=Photobacterium marinum TaxID=1056511 RepID=L8JH86_9GAMM|nr:MFS transporter [Photobacterium marinum]ELR66777.1 multidrug-efflux transporter [Photobacterium marinum]